MRKSTRKNVAKKPAKPPPDFPLFRHARGYWAKKVRGKTKYFGKIADDPDGEAALKLWLEQKDDLLAGRIPKGTEKKPIKAARPRVTKPPDFPLFPHTRGYWAKKVRGKIKYFGKIADDPEGKAALELWLDQKDDLLAGRTPRIHREGLTLRDLANRFMTAKKHLLETSEITPRTFSELHATCKRLGDSFGMERFVDDLAADDFERLRRSIAKAWGPIRLGNEIQRVRSVFKYGYDAGLIAQPVRFGPTFEKPTRKVLRLNRAKSGPKMFEASEVRAILAESSPIVRTMVLLAINGGLGNSDLANMPASASIWSTGGFSILALKLVSAGEYRYGPKRQPHCAEALNRRPKHKSSEDAGLLFITKHGHRWGKVEAIQDSDTGKLVTKQDDAIAKEFAKVLKELKIARHNRGFYALRHTFETIGGESRDQVAVNYIMGHAPPDSDMASVYRERISDERLKAVTDHVHQWLFGAESKTAKSEEISDDSGTAATGK